MALDYRMLLKGTGRPMPDYDPSADERARERQQEIRALNRAISSYYAEGSSPPRAMIDAFDEVLAEERSLLIAAMQDTGEYFAWRLERHWPGIALNMAHLDPLPPRFDPSWSKQQIDGLFDGLCARAEAASAAHRRRLSQHGRGSVPQAGIGAAADPQPELIYANSITAAAARPSWS
jgi:hypothetical protein